MDFWLAKGVFRAKKQLRESAESASIAGGILRTIVGQTLLAVVLVAGLWLIDGHIAKLIAIQINKDVYASLLSTLAHVSGVFLGLYFTAVSVVASTVYARVPGDVRSVLMQEKVGTVYIRLVALLAAVSTMLLATTASGMQPRLLHLVLIGLLGIIAVFSFVALGTRAFYFFDPTSLAGYVARDLLGTMRHATPAGIEWDKASFQAHYQGLAERGLETYRNLVSLALAEAHLQGRAVASLISGLLRVLNIYAAEKIKMPSDSRWFKYEERHQEWFTTDYTQVAVALQTGTALRPKSVPDPMWFERRVERMVLTAIQAFIEQKDYRSIWSVLNAAQQMLGRLGERLSVEEGLRLYRAWRPEVRRVALLEVPAEEVEQWELRLAVIDVSAMGLVSLLLGVSKRVGGITAESLGKLVAGIDWSKLHQVYSVNVPRAVVEQLEYLRAGLEFERKVEGRLQSPGWYRKQIAAVGLARCLADTANSLVDELEASIISESKALIEAGCYLPATQLTQRGMEAVEKFRFHLPEIRGCFERLVALRRVGDIPWPSVAWEKLERRVEDAREALVVLFGQIAVYLGAASTPEGLPDYFGQSYAILAQESYVAMATGREDLFKKLFLPTFFAGLAAFDRLRERLREHEQQTAIVYSTEPIADLLELSGYAIIYSELDGKNFWDVTKPLWDGYFERLPDREAGAKFIHSVVEYRRSLFAILPRGLARTSWKQDLEHRLRDRGLMEDPFTRSYERHERGATHASPIIRALTRSRFLFEEPTDVFMAAYLLARPEAASLEVGGQMESFTRAVTRERTKGEVPKDDEETL